MDLRVPAMPETGSYASAYRIMCVSPEKLRVFGMFSDNVMHCLSVCFRFVIERPSVVHWGGLVKG